MFPVGKLLDTLGIEHHDYEVPPGPRGIEAIRTALDFLDDPVDLLRSTHRQYGPYARFWLAGMIHYLISDPEALHQVLVTEADSFEKDRITHELSMMLGQGLLTSEGDFWRRQRKLAAPALKRKQIASYADTMVAFTKQEVTSWNDGDFVDLQGAVSRLTMQIVVKTLFNLDPGPELDRVGGAVENALHYFHTMTQTLWRFAPKTLGTPARDHFDASVKEVDALIFKLIKARREEANEGDDLLYRLLVATDDAGDPMTDQQLRDEVITMFMAGHETTALTITYAWYVLSLNPAIAERVFGEVDRVLGERDATVEDVPRLEYTSAFVKETMRLYPPAWLIGREAVEDVEIGPYTVPKGTQVLIAQVVLHMLPEYFPDPLAFKPERWLDPSFERELPRHVYMPFGGGTRVCIGSHFAMMEAILVIATMAQHLRLKNRMSDVLEMQPAITMRPAVPIRMKVERRNRGVE